MTHVGQEALHQNWCFEVKPAGLELLAGVLCGKQWNLWRKRWNLAVQRWNLPQLPDLLIWNELGDP
jgi:hypothetical protein